MPPTVTDQVAWSVGQTVCHTEPCKKTAEPIEMPFGLTTWLGAGNHVLDRSPDPPKGKGNFEGGILL